MPKVELSSKSSTISVSKVHFVVQTQDKFQSMIISSKKDLSKSVLNINGVELTMELSVKLLGIELDNKLNLEKNISNIYKKSQKSTKCNLQTTKVYGT